MTENAGGLFRQKTIDKMSSPDELTDYLKVTSPSVWAVLAAVVVQGGAASVHVSDSHDIQEGMQLTVESQEHAIESVSADEYGKPVGHANVDLPNGTYNGTLVVDEAGRRSASVITRELCRGYSPKLPH